MSPFVFLPTSTDVDLDNNESRSGSASGSRSERGSRGNDCRGSTGSCDSYDPTPPPMSSGDSSREIVPTPQVSRDACSTSTNGACGSGSRSRSSRCEGALREEIHDADNRWDWAGGGTVDIEQDIEDEESVDLGDEEDRAYRARRCLRREGKRPEVAVQRVFSERKRTGRRRFRVTDGPSAPAIKQDIAWPSSPISPRSRTLLLNTLPSSSSFTAAHSLPTLPSTAHAHSSYRSPASASAHTSNISSDPAHDDALTSANPTSATTSPSSTSANTVGVVRHISSPIPIVAGTLAGVIALLAAIVVTIVVTRKNSAGRVRVRSRPNWLQQQQSGGDGSGGIALGVGLTRAPSRPRGSMRSGDGRRGARARDKARQRSRRRARSRSSSHETISEDDNGDGQDMRGSPPGSYGGAIGFGARGSVVRCFDIPVDGASPLAHPGTRSTRSSSAKVRKEKSAGTAMVNEGVRKLQEDVELGYDDEPGALDSPYIELHIRHHESNIYSKGQQPPSSAVYHYPPPASAYGTMSSASTSLSSPPLPPGQDKSSTHGFPHQYQLQQSHLLQNRGHTSTPVSLRPGHLTEQNASSIPCSSSLPSHTPPLPLHGPRGMLTDPNLTDVKDPNGPPDAALTMCNHGLEDLPPAYDTM